MSTPNVWLHRKQISTTDVKSPTCVGRTPWYDTTTIGSRSKSRRCKQTFLIGVAGGTASGKTSVCRAIVNNLQLPWVQILSLDCFYKPLTKEQRDNVDDYNFDHPSAFDWDLLLSVLQQLKQGKAVKCPQYDFTTHSRKDEYEIMYGADVVLCEGILILHNQEVLKQFDVKVFVKTDDDIRLIRRIKRDIKERGRTLDNVLMQYQKTVKPSYQLFCEPTQSVADIVIPRGRDNIVAIQLLCDHIKNKLIEGGNINQIFYAEHNGNISSNIILPNNDDNNIQHAVNELHNDKLNGNELLLNIHLLCNELLTLCIKVFIPRRFVTPSPANSPSPQPLPSKLEYNDEDITIEDIIEREYDTQSPEIGYFDDTETEDEKTNKKTVNVSSSDSDDVLSIQKIASLTINATRDSKHNLMDDLDEEIAYNENEIKTDGIRDVDICVVTIFSGGMLFGETIMEQMANNEEFNINYGSIHIFHESHKPSKPRFYDRKLPKRINEQKVIMVDAFIGTGNRARMAIQVIIDHHVPEYNICFISLVSSKDGLINLAKVFPNVQFITARMEEISHSDHWESVPVTSSLVMKYCKAAGIDIVEDETESSLFNTH